MKKFRLYVSWQEYAIIEVEAKSLAEAKKMFNRDECETPEHGTYVDDSIELDDDATDGLNGPDRHLYG